MSVVWIPIIGTVVGTGMVVAIVGLVMSSRHNEVRARAETEIMQMDMAYQRARESLSR